MDVIEALARVVEIDVTLTDFGDENLMVVCMSAEAMVKIGAYDIANLVGFLGQAYAAGRLRGRKESAMKEMLEMEERDE